MTKKSIKNFLNIVHANLRNLPARNKAGKPAVFLEGSWTFVLFVLFAVSCSNSPTNQEPSGTLTGTVKLEGQTNHSGVTVSLYKLAELDTTILRYNREYPNVGFPISQATEFDHRLGEVVAEAKTKQDGSFEIDGVEEGTYNLVAEKAGFGWKYLYSVRIDNGIKTSLTKLLNDRMTQFM